MRTVLLVAFGALAAVSCSGPMAPEFSVEMAITDSVVARRSQNEMSLAIPVRLKNLDSRVLYYEECGHALQRREGSEWTYVPFSQCRSVLPGYSIGLYQGESHLFTFRVQVSLPSEEWPATGVAGEYRMVLSAHCGSQEQLRPSAPSAGRIEPHVACVLDN